MLPRSDAAAADDVIERTLAAACLAVTAGGATLEEALVVHLAVLAERWPLTYALVVERIAETESQLSFYLPTGGCRDD